MYIKTKGYDDDDDDDDDDAESDKDRDYYQENESSTKETTQTSQPRSLPRRIRCFWVVADIHRGTKSRFPSQSGSKAPSYGGLDKERQSDQTITWGSERFEKRGGGGDDDDMRFSRVLY
ncbi:hypothetical protein TWF788_001220 [Orbilia oligospora]|uniref:Uncharacterized protein n=1 Tax=Orbilia oligospora TaxID=2813651 RepID=A0A7C8PA16_ORBOL|nr:hypothetical protein TWF788_001220 [Orbilia oligospora]